MALPRAARSVGGWRVAALADGHSPADFEAGASPGDGPIEGPLRSRIEARIESLETQALPVAEVRQALEQAPSAVGLRGALGGLRRAVRQLVLDGEEQLAAFRVEGDGEAGDGARAGVPHGGDQHLAEG